jgi:hypothetical protein
VYNKAVEEAKRAQDELFAKAGQAIKDFREGSQEAVDDSLPNTSALDRNRRKGLVDPSTLASIMGFDPSIGGQFRSSSGPGRVLTRGLLRRMQRSAEINKKRAFIRSDANNREHRKFQSDAVKSLRALGIEVDSTLQLRTQAGLAFNEFHRRFGVIGVGFDRFFHGADQSEIQNIFDREQRFITKTNQLGISFAEGGRRGEEELDNMLEFQRQKLAAVGVV